MLALAPIPGIYDSQVAYFLSHAGETFRNVVRIYHHYDHTLYPGIPLKGQSPPPVVNRGQECPHHTSRWRELPDRPVPGEKRTAGLSTPHAGSSKEPSCSVRDDKGGGRFRHPSTSLRASS